MDKYGRCICWRVGYNQFNRRMIPISKDLITAQACLSNKWGEFKCGAGAGMLSSVHSLA